MKLKHVAWIITAFVAVACMAAGVAVLVDKYFGERIAKKNYVDCGEDLDACSVIEDNE